LLPFFPPICRIAANRFSGQRGFDHGAVYALPSPGYSFHLVVFGKAGTPQDNKKTRPHPLYEMGVDGAWTAESLFGKCLPLATSAQDIHNGFKNFPGW
jgi:hypothetical protein